MQPHEITEWCQEVLALAARAPRPTISTGVYQIPILQYSPAWDMRRGAEALIAEVRKIEGLQRMEHSNA